MKTLLKILLISISFYACQNASDSKHEQADSSSSGSRGQQSDPTSKDGSELVPLSAEMDARKKLTDAIIASKQEINQLKSEISDSLTKSALPASKRSIFSKTIQDLEESSDLLNKQLETILIADLQNSRNKLNGIVKKMKDSQQELSTMVARLDKITGYLQMASTLIESLTPVKSPVSKPSSAKK